VKRSHRHPASAIFLLDAAVLLQGQLSHSGLPVAQGEVVVAVSALQGAPPRQLDRPVEGDPEARGAEWRARLNPAYPSAAGSITGSIPGQAGSAAPLEGAQEIDQVPACLLPCDLMLLRDLVGI